MNDYGNAVARANAFDAKVDSDATNISADYASVVALSIRQGFAATEITVSRNGDGGFNTSDVLMFMKGTFLSCLRHFRHGLNVMRSRDL